MPNEIIDEKLFLSSAFTNNLYKDYVKATAFQILCPCKKNKYYIEIFVVFVYRAFKVNNLLCHRRISDGMIFLSIPFLPDSYRQSCQWIGPISNIIQVKVQGSNLTFFFIL